MSDTRTSLREHNRAVWSSGDWEVMATYIAPAGPRLLERLPVGPGTRLLDVGTGSGGSVAIPAARRGATVIGSDITMVTAKATLGDRWPTVRAELDTFMAEMNEAQDGTMMTTNEYLQIIGRLAG